MKPLDNLMTRKAAGAGLMLVIVAAVTLEASSIIQYIFSARTIRQEAELLAESQLENTRIRIMDVIDQAESAVRNNIRIAQWCLNYPDSLPMVAASLVQDNPAVMGSTIALVPGYSRRYQQFSPYAMRSGEDIVIKSLATPEYDYPSQEWFTKPIETQQGYWSEPYLDENGGEVLMTTYSVPVRDLNGKIAAVLTADVSLDWLTELIGNIEIYPNAFSMVISREGQIMVCPAESLIMKHTVHEIASESGDSAAMKQINQAMTSGQEGNMSLKIKGKKNNVFFAPVQRTGWSMSIIIPNSEIYGKIRSMALFVRLLQILGIVMLILILRSTILKQIEFGKMTEKKERMESELKIGSAIQMSMVPKIFPPFPERSDLDMSASMIPAKEVGGDLYDFYISDERLYFCIGDVSGKGVPASLVMAITRTLFRTVSAHEKSPQRIVTQMNDSMSDMNENNMFVTFFCGILDLQTGHLRYCNAGHNAPLILTSAIETLPVEPNLPLGIMKGMCYKEQETDLAYDDAIFLYTDGITEAENVNNELFGETRMVNVLHTRRPAQEHLENLQQAVSDFVGTAPQSDDRTMLFIHYLNQSLPAATERHLILHNDVQQIPQLAEFVETIADEKKLDQGLAMSLNLALEEAVTNVIMYAYPEGDGLVDIEAIIREHTLEFIISDSGQPFDPTAAPEADTSLSLDDRPIGGLGIYLVRKLMDSVHYQRLEGKNILTLIKKLQ